MLNDPQTSYVSPDVLGGSFGDTFDGEFEGIGAHVSMNAAGKIVIVSPILGGPAEKAGIKAGDVILEVDGKSIDGLSLLGVVTKIRGPKGTIVSLLVKHLGDLDPVNIEVKRGLIPLTSVILRSQPNDRFAHIRISNFYPDTTNQLIAMVNNSINNGAEGLILDLRDNPGGPLNVAVELTSQFLTEGLVLYDIDGNNRKREWKVQSGGAITDLEVGETVFSVLGSVNGMFTPRGGQISPSVTSRGSVWKLPGDVEPLAFAGMVLTQVGYNCGIRPQISPGEGAVIIGDGMVGQWAAQTLVWRGASVMMVGRHNDRLEKIAGRPDTHVVNSLACDPIEEIKELLHDGAQVLVDTVGSIQAISQYMPAMNRFGHIVSAGFYGTEDLLALQPPRYKELSIDLVSGWTPERMDRTLTLIADGTLETLSLITHHFPVTKAADAWRLIEEKTEPVLGVILDW